MGLRYYPLAKRASTNVKRASIPDFSEICCIETTNLSMGITGKALSQPVSLICGFVGLLLGYALRANTNLLYTHDTVHKKTRRSGFLIRLCCWRYKAL